MPKKQISELNKRDILSTQENFHIRTDYMKRMIAKENLIFDNDVVITYNFYKRKQRIIDVIACYVIVFYIKS